MHRRGRRSAPLLFYMACPGPSRRKWPGEGKSRVFPVISSSCPDDLKSDTYSYIEGYLLIMALPSTIHKASIQLSHIDRGVYESLQATVARHPSETDERLVARLLAWAIYYEPELTFTKGICATDEPDIWVKGPDGRVLFWVEVGLPDADRVIKATRHAERVALLACGRALSSWNQQHLPKVAGIANLTVVSLDQAFINTLAARLDRSIIWSMTITEGMVYLEVEGVTLESAIQVKVGTLAVA